MAGDAAAESAARAEWQQAVRARAFEVMRGQEDAETRAEEEARQARIRRGMIPLLSRSGLR